ncbi:MAG: tRNA-dihydrouridine synthase family protein [Spirochaetota bacterium]
MTPDTRLILAPMATLTHPAVRTLVGEYGGCDLYFSEMISAEAILEAARRLAEEPVQGIDVNMGCSAPQIAKRGAGVTWMQYPEASARLIERIRAVAPGKTVSAKFRLGTGEDPRELVDFARALEAAGASFLTLHPRFRRQSYSRPAHWSYVARLREALSIPLYGSGVVTRSRRFCACFPKNLAFGHRLAAQVQQLESYEGIKGRVASYFAEHPEHRLLSLRAGGAAETARRAGEPQSAPRRRREQLHA